ncbi:hypothetical protein DOM22_12470 [Bdellovibrio sp. ZAP7]|uniref:hypothetical protein n=1 Tax=Bdellovibrio sp. ZAP7 TaxID=2231053 RepID=UPI00115A6E6C|nr:hypothetical protein [Bdellovibrio sp. ZAP7]QDK45905.1 hypothetical protein DOM22_12470 [Bdellovibrio sp. ZAP7]
MKSAWITAGLLVLSFQSHAKPQGGVDGGGGKSVVCRNSKGQITSAQTLDLFEAKNVYNLKLTSFAGTSEEISAKVQGKLKDSIGSGYDYNPFYVRVNRIMKFVPASAVIKPIDDAAEVVLPKNCQLEQLAHYVDDETLLVSQEIWNHLSNTEKAALISHEAVYRVDRAFGAKDSRRARRIVAHLFSDFAFEEVNGGIPKGAKSCTASLNGRMTYQFNYYPSTDGKNTVMQFEWFDGKPVFTKKTATFPIALPWLSSLPSRCNGNPECKVTEGVVASKFEGVGSVQVSRGVFKDGPYNREMFYLEDAVGKHTLNCYPGSDDNVVQLEVTKSTRYVIPAQTSSCYARKTAAANGTVPELDVEGAYTQIPKLLFKQTNPNRDLFVSAVKVSVSGVDGRETTCTYAGEQLASLSDQWWSSTNKEAVIPMGATAFGTDCPVTCGGFDMDKPYTATGTVKVYGYTQGENGDPQEGVVLSAPVTVSNF